MVMESAGAMVSVNCLEAVWCVGEVESVTVTLTVLELVAEGVPEITPVVAFILKPVGSPVAAHV